MLLHMLNKTQKHKLYINIHKKKCRRFNQEMLRICSINDSNHVLYYTNIVLFCVNIPNQAGRIYNPQEKVNTSDTYLYFESD